MDTGQRTMALRAKPPQEDLPVVALVGRPNVGKSTLFNSLTRTRDALVAPVPGVTRDRRDAIVERDGLRFRLVDTGGMPFDKATPFGAEVERQIAFALSAAAIVWVIVDAADGLNPYDVELARRVRSGGRPWLVIANKAEGLERMGRLGEFYRLGAPQVVGVSALHRRGLGEALAASLELVPSLRIAEQRRAPPPSLPSPPSRPSPPSAFARPENNTAARPENKPAARPELSSAARQAPHGSGEERAEETVPPAQTEAMQPGAIRVAFVGRPNVGKSSLVNAILGQPRFIVSDIPGTTREAVDVLVEVEGERYILVDTAGLRRKARTTGYLDKLSAVNTLHALDRAEVAVLVLDASERSVDQDARIAGQILERSRACVVALNKWDRVQGGNRPPQDVQGDIEHALRFLSLAEPVRVSAVAGTGLRHLFRAIRVAHRQFTRTVPTVDLNRALQIVAQHTPPPARGRAPTRVFYGTQTGTRPPTFKIFTNHPEQVRSEYTRFVEHRLRYHFGFEGTPLRIEWSGREKRDARGAAGAGEAPVPGLGPRAAPRRRPAGIPAPRASARPTRRRPAPPRPARAPATPQRKGKRHARR